MTSVPSRNERARLLRRFPWKSAGVLAVIVALGVAARFLPIRDALGHFQAWIAGLGTRGVLLFALAYAAMALLLGPVWLLTIAAGLTWTLPFALLLVSVVSTLSAAAAFAIARHFARARIERLAAARPRFRAIDRAVARGGWKIVFLLRLSPVVPYGISNYLYGVTAIRFRPFLLASWIGMLPGTILYLSLGAAGKIALGAAGPRERSPWEWAGLGLGLAATAAVTIGVARIAKRELARTRLADAEAAP